MAVAGRKPIDLYSIAFLNAPNPSKVAIILEELGLEFNIILLDRSTDKRKPYTNLNPNGRTPAIVDHNHAEFVL
ncbi:hypothetical protein OIDMADRAFT_51124 [Oidiodendron maius Zn]|uniref:GST N-terminal domain-containing protein n=1 Tax=Oidiodendron maius (strain Zn) TaxID=913774 RepID=A0A0C3D237_OIDMZ|nr:hypothetical protein OIDMADRAFT_51124 [Oidiodendron maius Zn]